MKTNKSCLAWLPFAILLWSTFFLSNHGLAETERGRSVFTVKPDRSGTLLNGRPFLVVGLRLSNGLISEAKTEGTGGNYWGSYSKQPGLYDYINIGVYTEAMKMEMLKRTDTYLNRGQGYLFASTWLQNPPPAGPNHTPGGKGAKDDPGVRWWLEHVKARFGSYVPTSVAVKKTSTSEPTTATTTIQVPRWQPRDFAFTAPVTERNPFSVALRATVTGPNGEAFTLPGFYDGNGTWKVRVSPTSEGRWSLVTQSEQPELHDQRREYTCISNPNPKHHGGLRVDTQNPHHFVYEDGTRFFLLGYECDWLWALDMRRPHLPTLNPFLDKLAAHGFNYLILNSYAHDTGWRKGKTGDDDYGPPELYAWEGANEQPDHSRFNLAYWQHYDRVIEALYRRGITAHILIKVYNKMVKWPAKGSAEDDLFFRWLIARYAAFPNIVWDFSKEAHNEKDLEYKLSRFRFLRENDPYHRLVTCHDDDQANDRGAYDAWNDFRADQHHSKWREKILQQRQRRAWPVVNVEFGYEHGPGGLNDKTYGVAQSPEEVIRRAWEISLAGGYTAYYYTHTAWDVIRPQDTPPGYEYFKNLRDFFEATHYWELAPAQDAVSAGWCLANPGKEYVVFHPQAAPFTLRVANSPGPLKAKWYQPLSGQWADAGSLSNGEQRVTPPQAWGAGPVALLVQKE